MYLIIDSRDKNKTEAALVAGNKIMAKKSFSAKYQASEKLLNIIDGLLTGKKLTRVKKIFVFAGPGSFTSLRTGATLANTFSYLLKIPVISLPAKYKDIEKAALYVNGMKSAGKRIMPRYGKKPNITKSK
ncbi:hypothetical protein C4569_02385 [Candidatus Parcubacteria bacterium]|nr:MAG: hypothetical protein C4569_02385 [Candidatus Parcubacteria bacterium]